MSYHRIITSAVALSLLLPGLPSLSNAAGTPTVATDPVIITPGSAFTTMATGFAPNSTVSILYEGTAEGAAQHVIQGYFGEQTKKTDATGSVNFSGLTAVYEAGTTSFTFKDDAGNTATGTVRVEGRAPKPFLFGPQVEVTPENIQVGITGVGWTAEKKKSVRAIDPFEQPYPPQFFDLCEGRSCPERDDGLKLVMVIPRSTPAGSHTLIVSEEGENDVRVFFTIPELPENKKEGGKRAEIFLVDPPSATVDVISISVRGTGWGPYDDRRYVKAWLVDPDSEQFYELTVDRNYRDCSFIKGEKLTGSCLLESDEIFLRLEIPEGIKQTLQPKKYALFIETEKMTRGAAPFTVLGKPTLDTKNGAVVAAVPDRGPLGTTTLLFGAGFPKKQIIDVRIDGVYVRLGGALWPNDDGTFENIPLTIPRTLTRNGKNVAVTPGPHTIELSAGKVSAKTTFVVEETQDQKKKEEEEKLKREEEERKKKEREEKERIIKEEERLKKEQEKIKKEEGRLEKERKKLEEDLKKKKEQEKKEKDEEDKARLEKERKKLEEDLKKKKEQEQKKEKQLEDVKDKREEINDRFCDSTLPLTFQPGCIQKKAPPTKSEFEGKPCLADRAITLQPGCIGQRPEEQKQLFAGKPCVADIPLTFQPGCVPREQPETTKSTTQYYVPNSSGQPCRSDIAITFQPGCVSSTSASLQKKPSVQYYVPDSAGKPCRSDLAITFQPGCVSAKPVEQIKPFAGKACDPNLPPSWQEGCVSPQGTPKPSPAAQSSAPTISVTVPSATPQKCNPSIPHYSQQGCIE